MEQFIGCDAHKKFSLFIALNQEGGYGKPIGVAHRDPGFYDDGGRGVPNQSGETGGIHLAKRPPADRKSAHKALVKR